MLTDQELYAFVRSKYIKNSLNATPLSQNDYAKIDAEVSEMKAIRDEKLNYKFSEEKPCGLPVNN